MKTSVKIIVISTMFLATGGVIYYYLRKKNNAPTGVAGVNNVPVVSSLQDAGNAIASGLSGILDTTKDIIPANSAVAAANNKVQAYTPSAPVPVKTDSVRDSYMRSLTGYFTDPKYLAAFNKMTNEELASSWYYVGTYLSPGVPLLNGTRQLANGEWDNSNPGNPGLYSKISAIRSKYGIF